MNHFQRRAMVLAGAAALAMVFFVQAAKSRAQVLPRGMKQAHPAPAPAEEHVTTVATVHLPHGEKLVQYVPQNWENGGTARFNSVFITAPRGDEMPRVLSVLKPGTSPHSLIVDFYIQEH